MEKSSRHFKIENLITVLIGALLMGMLWRIRGTGGWGSSWGLLNAGFIFAMFIALIKGERQKTQPGWIALTALSFMLTTPSWGTLLNQISGILHKAEFWAPGDPAVYISIPSALFLMVNLGFGLAAIFGIMLGRGYSEKQWKLKDFIIVLAIFYAVDLLTKATLAHYVLDLIQPQAGEIFAEGLKTAGLNLTPHQAFLENFNDLAWSKQFDGGRNYFSSIQAISSTFRAIAALVATRFIVKDKISARIGAVVCASFAFSITVSDLFFYFANGGYHMAGISPFSASIAPWSCWEYFTGFIAGGIITASVLFLKNPEDKSELAFESMPAKPKGILNFIFFFVALLGLTIVRPVLVRFEDSQAPIVAIIIAVVVTVALITILTKKYGFNTKNISSTELYQKLLPLFVLYIICAYMFIALPEQQEFRYLNQFHNILTLISAIAVIVWSLVKNKKLIKRS